MRFRWTTPRPSLSVVALVARDVGTALRVHADEGVDGVAREGRHDGPVTADGNCIKIGLPGKWILGGYFQENRTSRRPFLLYSESVFREDLFLYNSSLASAIRAAKNAAAVTATTMF